MRIIEREAVALRPPTKETLLLTYEGLKRIHGSAYDWDPPAIGSADLATSRAMRSHVRRWINEWDLKRLYPGATVQHRRAGVAALLRRGSRTRGMRRPTRAR